ncbi:Salicylate 1-monooxygenase [Paenibacillus nuruki]|uniref:Salicylate 1-monooxygenase n=1 Tax=Paenibacillus nuruki TaxID=1886670 RepID=A0A1E3L6Z8_9BACL|nr:FAD-dependent monooxygenase [Paenibacillus nuruki]ODP29371.1 Salicylate 1-monooxygenase [Paenibacillus nuruki]
MSNTIENVIIIGAGIGGLSAAISLRKIGLHVTLCEGSAHDAPAGTGITQPQNTFKVLKDLGVYEECLEHGVQLDSMQILNKEGRILLEVNQKFLNEDLPGRNSIWRSSLNDILLTKALSLGVTMQWNKKLKTYEEDEQGITVYFEDDTILKADLLVGFDGIHSRVRNIMLQREVQSSYLGMGSWRVPIEFPAGTLTTTSYMLLNEDNKVGIFPLTATDGYMFILKPVQEDYRDPKEQRYDTVRNMLEPFQWKKDFLNNCFQPDSPILFNMIRQVVLKEKWYSQRVVIGGDAAHASAPNLAQGAAMAIEDAIVLAEEIDQHHSLSEALSAYYDRRYPRAREVQRLSEELLINEMSGKSSQQEIIQQCDALLERAY